MPLVGFGYTSNRVMKTIYVDEKLWENLKPYMKQMRTSYSKEIELFLTGLLSRIEENRLNEKNINQRDDD